MNNVSKTLVKSRASVLRWWQGNYIAMSLLGWLDPHPFPKNVMAMEFWSGRHPLKHRLIAGVCAFVCFA